MELVGVDADGQGYLRHGGFSSVRAVPAARTVRSMPSAVISKRRPGAMRKASMGSAVARTAVSQGAVGAIQHARRHGLGVAQEAPLLRVVGVAVFVEDEVGLEEQVSDRLDAQGPTADSNRLRSVVVPVAAGLRQVESDLPDVAAGLAFLYGRQLQA